MPKTKMYDGKPYKRQDSYPTKAKADSAKAACKRRGYNARIATQSGPRVKNKYVLYARKA